MTVKNERTFFNRRHSMKTKIVTIIGIVLCTAIALPAIVIRNYCEDKEERIITDAGIFNEDYLFLGNELHFSGEAEDMLFLGKSLTLSGRTKLGLIALCKQLIFSGEAGNGIITGGMNIVVDGKIGGNNYVGCKSFHLTETGAVNGAIFAGCAKLLIDGRLYGDLYAGAGDIVINNEIQGNVTAYGGRITIGEKGKINGNLTYSTKEKMSDESLARVTGSVKLDEHFKGDKEWNFPSKMKNTVVFFICLAFFVSFIFVGSALLFIPAFRKLDTPQSPRTFWNTALWGIIPVLMFPALIVLCFAMVVTIPFAFVLMLAFIPLFYMTNLIGITLVGKYVVTKFKWKITKRHYQFLIGALASVILLSIPFINFLATLFISALGCGVFISFLFNKDLSVAG